MPATASDHTVETGWGTCRIINRTGIVIVF
jgi:hypothetical protein